MNDQMHSKIATHKTATNQNLLRHARLKYANAQCNTHIELLAEGPKKEFSLFISIIVFEPQNKLVSLKHSNKPFIFLTFILLHILPSLSSYEVHKFIKKFSLAAC